MIMNPAEYLKLMGVVRASGSYNDAEPLYYSVKRIVDERNSERSRGLKLRQELHDAGVAAEAASDRIRALENEIRRLSIARGAPVGWNPNPSPVVLPPPPLAPPQEDRSRVGRQRRELRRLNTSQRALRLEADYFKRLFEDSSEQLIKTRQQLRREEAVNDSR